MVEGLTSSATDQGSVAAPLEHRAHRARSKCNSSRSKIQYTERTSSSRTDPGDSSGEATPVPIPNTEVKLSSAEDTERAAFREHRSSPGFLRFQGQSPGRLSGIIR